MFLLVTIFFKVLASHCCHGILTNSIEGVVRVNLYQFGSAFIWKGCFLLYSILLVFLHSDFRGSSISFINKLYFFREVLGLQQNWAESIENSHIFLPFSSTQPPAPELSISYNQWTNTDSSLSPKVHSLHYGSHLVPDIVGLVRFYGFGQMYSDMILPVWYHTE